MTTLKATDGVEIKIAQRAVRHSEFLSEMLENVTDTDIIAIGRDTEDKIIHDIPGTILKVIVDFLEEYERETSPMPADELKELTRERYEKLFEKPWVAKYIRPANAGEIDMTRLFETLKSAHYLAIDPLDELLCRQVARLIQGKTPEEIRKVFGLPDKKPEETVQKQ